MAPKQTGPSLPEDQETLRFYLKGVHHFLRWCEAEIAAFASLPILGPGRLFVAIAQILEPYLRMRGDPRGETIYPQTVYPSAFSNQPFQVTPAFLAIRPFLDDKKLAANLERCRAAVEALGPIPRDLNLRVASAGRKPIKITKHKNTELSAEDRKALAKRNALETQHREKLWAAIEAINGLLDPFRDLVQRIVLKMAGGSEQSPDVPEDSASLYLPMKTFVVEHFKGSYSRFNKWLNKHPEVSTRPRGGRGRNVHAIEFHKAYEKEKKENFKKLDNSKDAQKKQGEQTARKKAEILRQRGVSEEEIAKITAETLRQHRQPVDDAE